jgi:hypothetical protein
MTASNKLHPLHPGYDDQERALLRERTAVPSPHDPRIDAYRAVHRAIIAAPMPQPPADFAARMAAEVGDLRERAQLEALLQRLLLIAVVVATLMFAGPYLMAAAADVAALSHDLPLPMLLATGIGLAFAAAIDRLASGHRHPA